MRRSLPDKNFLLGRATTVAGQAEILTRSNLRELEEVVKYTAQMPGQRIVILGSPGFLLQDDNQFQLERIIDQALRLQVVISSLDPRGLPVLARQADASQIYIPAQGERQAERCIAWTKTGKWSQGMYWHRLRKAPAANSFTTTTI